MHPMMAIAPRIVTLPIVSIKKDQCKIPHIIAKKDQRPVDGIFQQLEVVDNTKSKCMYALSAPGASFRMPAPTVVVYTTEGFDRVNHRGSFSTVSSFEGEKLAAVK